MFLCKHCKVTPRRRRSRVEAGTDERYSGGLLLNYRSG